MRPESPQALARRSLAAVFAALLVAVPLGSPAAPPAGSALQFGPPSAVAVPKQDDGKASGGEPSPGFGPPANTPPGEAASPDRAGTVIPVSATPAVTPSAVPDAAPAAASEAPPPAAEPAAAAATEAATPAGAPPASLVESGAPPPAAESVPAVDATTPASPPVPAPGPDAGIDSASATVPLPPPPRPVALEPLPEVPPQATSAVPGVSLNGVLSVLPLEGSLDFLGPPRLVEQGDPASPQFIGPPLVPPLKLLGQEVLPGSKRQLLWSAGSSFAGGDSVAPVNVVRGTRPGPVLCLTSAIHGDELNGVEIVRRIVNGLNPDRLSGTVVGVPIVNMFGFSRGSRYLPDRRDLNRFFPGSQRGSIASRVAFSFFNDVARYCDALVDFHTGSFDRDNLPQVRADLRLTEVLRFARGFGTLPVLHSDGSRGMLRVALTQAGIPAVTFEVGAPGVLQVEQIKAAETAIDALMHHIGMVPDEPLPQEPQAIFYESRWIRANGGGLLISQVALGERVEPGQCLGIVIDPVRNTERRIESPIHGRVIGMARNQVVLPGFAAFHIGEETSAERASDAAASGEVEEGVEEDPDPDPGLDPEDGRGRLPD